MPPPSRSNLQMLADIAQLQSMSRKMPGTYPRVMPRTTPGTSSMTLQQRYGRLGKVRPVQAVGKTKPRLGPEHKAARKAYVLQRLKQEERRLRAPLVAQGHSDAVIKRRLKKPLEEKVQQFERQFDTNAVRKMMHQAPSMHHLRPMQQVQMHTRLKKLSARPPPPRRPASSASKRKAPQQDHPRPSAAKKPKTVTVSLAELTNMKRFLKHMGYKSSQQYSSGQQSGGQSDDGDQRQRTRPAAKKRTALSR